MKVLYRMQFIYHSEAAKSFKMNMANLLKN